MTKKYVKASSVKAGSRIPNPRRASLPKLGWAGSVNNSAAGQYMAGNADALSAAGATAAGYLTAADQMDGKTNLLASAGSGALQGAATGLMFGPAGAIIGGAIGLAGGAIMGKLKQNAEEDAREAAEKAKRQREESIRNQREAASIAANSALMANYPTSGVANAGFAMAYGGTVGNPTFSEQSIKAQGLRPFSRSNADGSESTVLMASGSADGKYYAFPTLFPAAGNSGSRDPKNWIQPKDPFAEAQKRGELFPFGTEAEAQRFAGGSWKTYTNIKPKGMAPFAYGGKIPDSNATYLAEDQEVIQHAPNDRPDTDRNGGVKKLNSNTSKFVGDTHEDPSQGIGGVNNSQARMYSNRLYVPQNLKDQLKKL